MGTARDEFAPGQAAGTSYWQESARPLTSLAFVAPILLLYEAGVLLLGSAAARNGADVWMRGWLDGLGFGHYFLLPALACSLLLAWHHTRREAWRFRWSVLGGMALECLALAMVLVVVAEWHQDLWHRDAAAVRCAAETTRGSLAARLVAYCGAGIYEEVLFRLMLLPAFLLGLRALGVPRLESVVVAIVVTSLIFAAAHYRLDLRIADLRWQIPYGDPFAWDTYWFRFLAGAFFASLFVTRGFGIAVGAHALYDIFAVLL